MKKSIAILLCIIMVLCSVPLIASASADLKTLEINELNFPDEEFRNFIAETFDLDNDGIINELDNLNRRTHSGIEIAYSYITSLQGLDLLLDLFEIDPSSSNWEPNCNNRNLTIKDTPITELSSVNTLQTIFLDHTQIEKLDLTNSESLISLTLQGKDTVLYNLDLRYAKNLQNLGFAYTNISTINISENLELTEIFCRSSDITELDLTNNAKLKELNCCDTQILELNLSNNPELEYLDCSDTQISELNLSNNAELKTLHCSDTRISNLDLSNNIKLEELWCERSHIRTIDLGINSEVSNLNCYGQTIEADYAYDSDSQVIILDMKNVVDDISRVTIEDTDNYTYDNKNGIVTLHNPYAEVTYLYNVNYVDDPNMTMDVTVTGLLGDADYTEVDKAIACIPTDLSNYTDESIKALNEAVDAVIRGLTIADQKSINDCAQSIYNAIDALEYKPADYSAVDKAISKIPTDLSVFTDESVEALQAAIDAVEYGKNIMEQDIVDFYAQQIEAAIAALEYKPADYSAIEKAIGKVPADLSIYTDESVKALQDALDAVEYDKDITEQDIVDGYAEQIEAAIKSLTVKEVPKEPTPEGTTTEEPAAEEETTQNTEQNTSNTSPNTGGSDFLFTFFIVLVILVAFTINVLIIKKAMENNKTAKTTFIPFQPTPADNENHTPLTALQKIDGKCMYCGKEIAVGSEYCNHCGKKQTQEYVKIFNKQNMNNDEFIVLINKWLADNPRIANVSCEFNTRTGWGWFVNKYVLDSVAFKYELFRNNNENQYALIELSKFGFYHKPTKKLLDEWKAKNPQVTILKTSGGSHSRGQENHDLFWGIGANNNTQLFVFFKFKR